MAHTATRPKVSHGGCVLFSYQSLWSFVFRRLALALLHSGPRHLWSNFRLTDSVLGPRGGSVSRGTVPPAGTWLQPAVEAAGSAVLEQRVCVSRECGAGAARVCQAGP